MMIVKPYVCDNFSGQPLLDQHTWNNFSLPEQNVPSVVEVLWRCDDLRLLMVMKLKMISFDLLFTKSVKRVRPKDPHSHRQTSPPHYHLRPIIKIQDLSFLLMIVIALCQENHL